MYLNTEGVNFMMALICQFFFEFTDVNYLTEFADVNIVLHC